MGQKFSTDGGWKGSVGNFPIKKCPGNTKNLHDTSYKSIEFAE